MGLKPDHWIRRMAVDRRMIEPFSEGMSRTGVISFGDIMMGAVFVATLDSQIEVDNSRMN